MVGQISGTKEVTAALILTMQITDTNIADVKIITPRRFEDDRGFFSETFNDAAWKSAGFDTVFVQDNHSYSQNVATVRALHFQRPPFAQAKLVRVIRGRVIDIAVDLRQDSPTFRQHVRVELSASNWKQLFLPAGFAHGFCTLEADTEVVYKVSSPYSHEHDDGIMWNDPSLGIDWGMNENDAVLSEKDTQHPLLEDADNPF